MHYKNEIGLEAFIEEQRTMKTQLSLKTYNRVLN